jgi:hypothetical protein
MSNKSNLFATSFFQEIKDHEKKKSTGNATRRKIGSTKWPSSCRMVWSILCLVGPNAENFGFDETILT